MTKNFAKKFGGTKTSWEFPENMFFGRFRGVWIRIWSQIVQENSCCWDIELDAFACPQLYVPVGEDWFSMVKKGGFRIGI